MATKKKEHENLSESNIEKVIELLESESPITKKEACELLNICYNTTRLKKIIDEHKDKQNFRAEMRKKKKGTEVSDIEVVQIIKSYLSGEAISNIADSMFRSATKVKKVLVDNNIPLRESGTTYNNPPAIPDDGIKEDYEEGDLVYSARYNVPALITKLVQIHDFHGKVYGLWLMGKEQQFAYQPFYELADLTHIQQKVGKKFNYEE